MGRTEIFIFMRALQNIISYNIPPNILGGVQTPDPPSPGYGLGSSIESVLFVMALNFFWLLVFHFP